MSVVRSFERRLERLLEGVAGRVFSGRLHPSEIAGRLAREADFARFEHETGPATANLYTILVNPRDLTTDPGDLAASLAAELDRHTAEEGLRLEGPCRVVIATSDQVSPGALICHVEVSPGAPVVWARLVSVGEAHDVGRNRAVIGRSGSADVTLPHDEVSRRHAVLWREGGRAWVRDLGSANGTVADGTPVGDDPTEIGTASVIVLAGHRYRFNVT